MIRKFRAIVRSKIEPTDHEVIWSHDNKLQYWDGEWKPVHVYDATETEYIFAEDSSIVNVAGALDKLLYKPIIIERLADVELGASPLVERGLTVQPNIIWEYNKEYCISQSIAGIDIPVEKGESFYSYQFDKEINNNNNFTLRATDGTTSVSKMISYRFTDMVYYGSGTNDFTNSLGKFDFLWGDDIHKITITANKDEYIYIFKPSSAIGIMNIYYDGVLSNDSFTITLNYARTADTGYRAIGRLYKSKNPGLGEITLIIKREIQ